MEQEKHSINKAEAKRRKKKEALRAATPNYLNDKLQIENKYASLISLINTIYPPLLCTLCDTVSTSAAASKSHFNEKHKKKLRYLCIHPHCDQRFLSRGALRFHISRSHLVNNSKKPLPDPTFIHYTANEQQSSHRSLSPSPMNTLETVSPTLGSTIELTSNSPPIVPLEIHTSTTSLPKAISLLNAAPNKSKASDAPSPIKNQPSATVTATQLTASTNIRRPLQNNHKSSVITTTKKEKLFTPTINSLLIDNLTPSPPTSPPPFSLYHRKTTSKKLSTKAEAFLNSIYPPLQCPACEQFFNRKTNVIRHLTESHLGQEPYRCIYPKCGHHRMYATREGLIYHIIRVHDQVKQ